MKKIKLCLILTAFLGFSSLAFAGKLKELVLDADEAINYEFYENGDRTVLQIENHQLISTKVGVGVTAIVTTKNVFNNTIQTWNCLVSFTKNQNEVFEFQDIDCK